MASLLYYSCSTNPLLTENVNVNLPEKQKIIIKQEKRKSKMKKKPQFLYAIRLITAQQTKYILMKLITILR